MRRRGAAAAVAVLTAVGTAAGIAIPAQARQAGSARWRIVKVIAEQAHSVVFNKVVSTDSRNAWVAGSTCPPCNESDLFATKGLILEHWTGDAWNRVRPPRRLLLGMGSYATMDSSSPTCLWILGGGQISTILLRYSGGEWTRTTLPVPPLPKHNYGGGSTAFAFGAEDVWIFVGDFAFHYTHHRWQRMRLPAALRAYGNVSFVSSTDIWALGRYSRKSPLASGNRYAAMHWNGKSWSVVSLSAIKLPSPTEYRLGPIVATGPRDLWVLGDLTHAPFLLHWTGPVGGWSRVDLPAGTNTIYGMTSDGAGGLWLYAYLEDQAWQFDRYTDGLWTHQPVPSTAGGFATVYSMALIPGTHSVCAVGASLPSTTATNFEATILKFGP